MAVVAFKITFILKPDKPVSGIFHANLREFPAFSSASQVRAGGSGSAARGAPWEM